VVLEGLIRAEGVEEADLRGRLDDGMLAHILFGRDAGVIGMLLAIPLLDRCGGGVLEDRDGVAGLQVSSENSLAYDEGLVMRAIVVGNVDLVKASAQPGELKRRAPDLEPPVLAAYPEARVASGDEELRPRGLHALRSTAYEHEDEERYEARHAPQI
jgi:hypothetical protein